MPEASRDRSLGKFAERIASIMQLPEPWIEISETDAETFEDEYAVEIEKGHPLYGVPVRAVAKRDDSGEILFRLLRHLCEYASVALTWSGRPENRRDFPEFTIFVDEDDLHGRGSDSKSDIPF